MAEQMTAVAELLPGDLVTNAGQSATFITHTAHPLWPHLRLVIWRMADGTWYHDALDARQQVGEVEPADLFARRSRLQAALLGDGVAARCRGAGEIAAPSGEQSDRTDWRREAELLDRTLTQAARRFIEVVREREEARSELARVRAQVAAETAALRHMIEWAIRSADWEPGDAQRALWKLRDDYARLEPSGSTGNPADHPESRWQYVEPTDG